MRKVLFVNGCVREDSRTLILAKKVIEKLGGEVSEVRLCTENIVPLCWEDAKMRGCLVSAGDFSSPLLKYAKQFSEADEIVIAAPYWDLLFPAAVRIYLEHVTVTGVTFKYSQEGIPVGLCKAGRLIYVTTAGGPIVKNMGYDYVRALSETFYGIPETMCFTAENLDIWGADVEEIMAEAIKKVEEGYFF